MLSRKAKPIRLVAELSPAEADGAEFARLSRLSTRAATTLAHNLAATSRSPQVTWVSRVDRAMA
jgi:hypothetical protein